MQDYMTGLWTGADANGDANLDQTEMSAFYNSEFGYEVDASLMPYVYGQYDSNADGKVTQ